MMFQLYMRRDGDRLRQAALEVAAASKVWLFGTTSPTEVPGYQKTEITIGEAAAAIPLDELRELFAAVLARARG